MSSVDAEEPQDRWDVWTESHPDEDEICDEDLPDAGQYVITLTIDHEQFNPIIDFGGAPLYLVKSVLMDTLETIDMISPPVTIASNGSLIFSPFCDDDEDEDD